MQGSRKIADNVDDYIAHFPPETQERLQELRRLIKGLLPDAEETISYAIPTYKQFGTYVIYFAGYAKHVSIYPIPAMDTHLDDIEKYQKGKGTLQFKIDEELPADFIKAVVKQALKAAEARKSYKS